MALAKVDVLGLREAQATFRQLEPEAREAYIDIAVRPTLSEISRGGAARLMPGRGVRTGALQAAIGFSVNAKSGWGKVGVRAGFDRFVPGRGGSARTAGGAMAIRPTRYGHLYHFQHDPFLLDATERERGEFLARARQAGRTLEQRMGAIGNAGTRML